MKSIIIFSLVSMLNQPFSFLNNQNFDINKNFGFTANDIFNYGDISRFVIVNNAATGAMTVEYKNVDEIDKFYPMYYFK